MAQLRGSALLARDQLGVEQLLVSTGLALAGGAVTSSGNWHDPMILREQRGRENARGRR
jgi:hypothetical protein